MIHPFIQNKLFFFQDGATIKAKHLRWGLSKLAILALTAGGLVVVIIIVVIIVFFARRCKRGIRHVKLHPPDAQVLVVDGMDEDQGVESEQEDST